MNETISRYEKLLAQHPTNELARFSLGKAWFDLGQFAKAKEHLEFALARKPDWMVVQIVIGKCELSLGRTDRALEAFRRARQLAIDQHHEGPLQEMEELIASLEEAGPKRCD